MSLNIIFYCLIFWVICNICAYKNLEEILKAYLNEGSTEMNTQIQFIINQINSVDKQTLNESDNEEDDEDEVFPIDSNFSRSRWKTLMKKNILFICVGRSRCYRSRSG